MKRQIICSNCEKKFPLKKYDGEWVRRIAGKAKRDFVCDLCGEVVHIQDLCFADSMGLDHHDYYKWEEEYL